MNPREILRHATGLDLDEATLERALHARMKGLGLEARSDYLALLSGPELDALAELVVVPESWMFRDPAAFQAALALATGRLARRPGHLVRILSLPCAGGEEPYSMAMALLDAGVPLDQCRIDGIDLSKVSIARARAGRYTRNAFRGARVDFRDRYFSADDGGYLLRDDIRAAVQFGKGNLFGLDMAANAGRYDVIFCRNLLIYFDDHSIARAAAVSCWPAPPSRWCWPGTDSPNCRCPAPSRCTAMLAPRPNCRLHHAGCVLPRIPCPQPWRPLSRLWFQRRWRPRRPQPR
jgi:chemotaxis protein methyltransferase WspC